MAKFTYEKLEQKYRGFTAPSAKLLLAGKPFSGYEVLSAECETGVGEQAGVCTVTLGGVYDRKNSKFLCEGELTRGMPVSLELGYITTAPVFSGFLYEICYTMGVQDEPLVSLVCMDVKAAMMGGGMLDISGGRTYQETIRGFFSGKNARGYSVLCKAPDMKEEELEQPVGRLPDELDDYGFMALAARRFGLEWFIRGEKMLLRRRPASPEVLIELTPAAGISVEARLRSAGYVRSVSVLGSNDNERDGKKKQLRGTAENPFHIAPDSSDAGRLLGKRGIEVFAGSARTDKAAALAAQGILRARQSLGSVLTLTMTGLPELLPGYAVGLGKVSPGLNGEWYLTSVTHRMDTDGFTTTAEGWRNI